MKNRVVYSLMLLFVTLTSFAQNTNKLSSMWLQIETMSLDNPDLEMKCVEYINAAPLLEEHAFRCRLLLADYYMSKKDMMGIYLQYAYLKYYLKQNPDNEIAREYKVATKNLYFSLVKADMENLLPAGRYFSPDLYVGFIIRDSPEGKTCEMERTSEFLKKCKYKLDYRNGFLNRSPLVVNPDDEQWMTAEFTYNRVKNGNSTFAQSLIKNRNEMRAEGHGTVSESDANLGQRALGHAATDISAGMMTLLARAVSKSKAINHEVSVSFRKAPYNMGYIANFNSLKKTITSNSSRCRRQKIEGVLRLFKMYPHYMECFDEIIKIAGFNYDPVDYNPIYQKLNPNKFFPQYFMNTKSFVPVTDKFSKSAMNKMPKFLFDFIFKPWITKKVMETSFFERIYNIPPINLCKIDWTPYSIGYFCDNKKYDYIHAEIMHSGKIRIAIPPQNGGCLGVHRIEYDKEEMGEEVNILATDPYDN